MAIDASTFEISADAGAFFEFCLEMECAAAETYLRFVYDDFEHALAVQRFLGERGLLESSAPYGRVLLKDGEPMALTTGVPGPELKKLRMKSALALQGSDSLRPSPATRARMQLAHKVLFTPTETDLYSSKLGVSPKARGMGAGPLMMRFITDEARARGFSRIMGEVHPENHAMMRVMCEKVGWDRVNELRVEDPETGRWLAYVHVAQDLS